jgi:hypothetical protein
LIQRAEPHHGGLRAVRLLLRRGVVAQVAFFLEQNFEKPGYHISGSSETGRFQARALCVNCIQRVYRYTESAVQRTEVQPHHVQVVDHDHHLLADGRAVEPLAALVELGVNEVLRHVGGGLGGEPHEVGRREVLFIHRHQVPLQVWPLKNISVLYGVSQFSVRLIKLG